MFILPRSIDLSIASSCGDVALYALSPSIALMLAVLLPRFCFRVNLVATHPHIPQASFSGHFPETVSGDEPSFLLLFTPSAVCCVMQRAEFSHSAVPKAKLAGR
eukprot:scaffold130401_cov32-Tisochrysis_lutea.AAC.1